MASRLLLLARSCSTVEKHSSSRNENQQRTARILRKNMKSAVVSHLSISSSILNIAQFSAEERDFIARFSEDCLVWLNACDALKDSLCHFKSYYNLVLLALRSLTRNYATSASDESDLPKDSLCSLRERKHLSKSRKILADCMESIRYRSERSSKLEECRAVLRKMKKSCRLVRADSDTFVGRLQAAHISTTLVCYAAVNALLLVKSPHKLSRLGMNNSSGRDRCGILDSSVLLFEFYSVHSEVIRLCNLLDEKESEDKIRSCVNRLHEPMESLGRGIVEVLEQVRLLHRLLVCNRMSFMGILTGHRAASACTASGSFKASVTSPSYTFSRFESI